MEILNDIHLGKVTAGTSRLIRNGCVRNDTTLEKLLGNHMFVRWGFAGERFSLGRWMQRHVGTAGISSLSPSVCSLHFGSSLSNLEHFAISATRGTCLRLLSLLEAGLRGAVYSTTTALVTTLLFTPTFSFSHSDS
jgi:hypothetical protein